MANANIVELTTGLDHCIKYCEAHPTREHCKELYPRLVAARTRLEESIKTTDRYFTQWKLDTGDDRLAWKHLAAELARTQTRLRKVNAVGYPDTKVMYWDTERLQSAVAEMADYLRERKEHLPFAGEQLEKFNRLQGRALSGDRESNEALRTYSRFVPLRAEAMDNASFMLGSFRVAMRRELGKNHQDYQAIAWPYSIASDETVL